MLLAYRARSKIQAYLDEASDDLTRKRIDVCVLKGVDGRRTDYRTTPAMVKRAVS